MTAEFNVEEEGEDDRDEDRPLTGDCCCQTNRDGECFREKGYSLNPSIRVCWALSSPNQRAEYKQDVHVCAEQTPNKPINQFKYRDMRADVN